MAETDELKNRVKEPVKNIAREVVGDIVYRIARAGTRRAAREIKDELKESAFRRLQEKIRKLSEEKIDRLLDEHAKKAARQVTEPGAGRQQLVGDIEREFRYGLKKTLAKMAGPLMWPTVVAFTLVIGGLAWIIIVDREPPEVWVTARPGHERTVTFTVEASDNRRVDWIELAVEGEVVEQGGASPLEYTGGPYPEGMTAVSYTARAWDLAGNEGIEEDEWPLPQSPPPVDRMPPKLSISPFLDPRLRTVSITVEATDDSGIEWVQLTVNGRLEKEEPSSSLKYLGGPYPAGSTVRYSAIARDGAGNQSFPEEGTIEIPALPKPQVLGPDLVVSGFEVTGPLRLKGGNILAPVRVVVWNKGNATAGRFKVAVEGQEPGEPYSVRPFTVPGQNSIWYPFTDGPLPAGAEVVFEGDVNIGPGTEFGGLTVNLRITADSCLGDELQPPYCRVEESDEGNNEESITVRVPDTFPIPQYPKG